MGTVISIIPNVIQVIDVIKDIKASSEDREKWRATMKGLLALLRVLDDRYRDAALNRADPWYQNLLIAIEDGVVPSKDGSRPLGGIMLQLNNQVKNISNELNKHGLRKRFAQLTHTLKKTEIEGIFEEIHELMSLLDTFLGQDQFALSRDNNKKLATQGAQLSIISQNQEDQKRRQTEKDNLKIQKWLSPLEFLWKHKEIHDDCFQTGQWLLKSVEFLEWERGSTWPLYCLGNAGAGKVGRISSKRFGTEL